MSFPTSVVAVAAGVLGTGLAHQLHATIGSRRAHAGWSTRTVTCQTENRVVCHHRDAGPEAPHLFFEAGLMNTSTAWLALADALGSDVSITIHDRAGYRSSMRRQTEPYALQESVSDFVDVVEAHRRSSVPTWLVGHSLGGYMAHRAASVLHDLAGLVLIDPMHPQELTTSQQQRQGARSTDLSLRTGPLTVALGGGLLMDKPGVLSSAARNRYRPALARELSAASTWRAALREWRYVYPFMLDGGTPLVQLDIPVHVLAADRTVEQSPDQQALYRTYIASGTSEGRSIVVPDTDHLNIVNDPQKAGRAAEQIRAVVLHEGTTNHSTPEVAHAHR